LVDQAGTSGVDFANYVHIVEEFGRRGYRDKPQAYVYILTFLYILALVFMLILSLFYRTQVGGSVIAALFILTYHSIILHMKISLSCTIYF